jgi:hypothetical protein
MGSILQHQKESDKSLFIPFNLPKKQDFLVARAGRPATATLGDAPAANPSSEVRQAIYTGTAADR